MNTSESIGVASRSFSSNEVLKEEISKKYPNVKFNTTGKDFKPEELIDFLKDCSGAIISTEKFGTPIVDKLPKLKVLSKYGVGLDNVDLDALEKNGVQISWQPGTNRRSVSELALGLMISSLRFISLTHHHLRNGDWHKISGRLLSGRSVGIIGCGRIGKDLVQILKPFGCEILAHDIRSYDDFYKEHGVKAVSLEELLSSSDIVTIHVPLTEKTRHLISKKEFELMKERSLLINTARGNIVCEESLKWALREKIIAGAAFDVYAQEPGPDQELFTFENFIGTPHIAGNAEEAVLAMGRLAIEGLNTSVSIPKFREYLETV